MHNKDTYVLYHLYLPGGGLWGIMPAVQCAFIEETTGRKISDFFDSVEGASIGSVLATGMMIPDQENPGQAKHTCKQIAQGFFNCGRKLFPKSTGAILARQIAGRVSHMITGRNFVGDAHFEHMVLRDTLSSFYGGVPFESAVKTLFVSARNMTAQETHYFGRVDDTLFDPAGMRIINKLDGVTPMLDGTMCSTAVPMLFKPYKLDRLDAHFEDYAPFTTPLTVYREVQRMAEMRQKKLREEFGVAAARSIVPLVPRTAHAETQVAQEHPAPQNAFMRAVTGLMRLWAAPPASAAVMQPPLPAEPQAPEHAADEPKTLANTRNIAVRLVYMETGEQNTAYNAEINNMADLGRRLIHTIDAASRQTTDSGMAMLEADYGGRVTAATGQKLMTRFNRRITPANDAERAEYPSDSFLDGSDENLFRIYNFAKNYVLENLDTTRALITEITAEKKARGEFPAAEAERITAAMLALEPAAAATMLDGIIVHKGNYKDILANPPCDVESALRAADVRETMAAAQNRSPLQRLFAFTGPRAPRPSPEGSL